MAEQAGGRNKLLHRFYEPLHLLHALDSRPDDKKPRPCFENASLQDISLFELQKRFLDCLSYTCDFVKGGDSTTAIFPTLTPLTYHIARNKASECQISQVTSFLTKTLGDLAKVYELSRSGEVQLEADFEARILTRCITESKGRLETYRKWLFQALVRSMQASPRHLQDLQALQQKLTDVQGDLQQLCLLCHRLICSSSLDPIRRQIRESRDRGDESCEVENVKHYIGRLADHVRAVKVLMETGRRSPMLFESPELHFIQPISDGKIPHLRRKANLDAILRRMVPADSPLLQEASDQLQSLDRHFNIHRTIKSTYGRDKFKPIMHAEMIVLEYLYSHWDELDLSHLTRYIGCSKPACYCCSLYIQHHPGRFVVPATHSKISCNWLPPTRVASFENFTIDLVKHEELMLNKMASSIREKLIEQIFNRGGRRKQRFDSVTWDSYARLNGEDQQCKGSYNQPKHIQPEVVLTTVQSARDEVSCLVSQLQASTLRDGDIDRDKD